ncbi:flavin reductase family protein [Ideonella sp. A 288]|uniref:flavin reductase family protein n=1 Tax=Ideonella sp. A 288 TaxID=1962181 RepID=UPI000B4BDFFB|nr:flavin reductase family protein [Ideonella sp. A 288]
MHYDPRHRPPELRHDPFKALVVPRPVGWVATLDREGRANLAPYSFFNAVNERPPMVMFSSGGGKDSLRNIEATGEFTCSMACFDQREAMNMSSASVAPGVDEFVLAGLVPAPSRFVAPPRVAGAPAAFECRLWQTLQMPAPEGRAETGNTVIFGLVVGVYIDDAFIRDGLVDTGAMRPLARLGYMDYSAVSPESVFTMNRPVASDDRQSATLQPGPWDGVYR